MELGGGDRRGSSSPVTPHPSLCACACEFDALVLSHYAQQGLGELACMCVSERANARNRE